MYQFRIFGFLKLPFYLLFTKNPIYKSKQNQTNKEQIKTFKNQGTKSKLAKLIRCTVHFNLYFNTYSVVAKFSKYYGNYVIFDGFDIIYDSNNVTFDGDN